jgi:hypothetical protein
MEEWLMNLDQKMRVQNRKILLFLDNAPAQEYLGKHKQFAQVTGTADLLSNIMNASDIVNKMSITVVKQKSNQTLWALYRVYAIKSVDMMNMIFSFIVSYLK